MGWFCVEDDGNQIKKERHPLLVGHMAVTVAKQQEFKVTAGGPGGSAHAVAPGQLWSPHRFSRALSLGTV